MRRHQFGIRSLLVGVTVFAALLAAALQYADNEYVIYTVVAIVIIAFTTWVATYEGPAE